MCGPRLDGYGARMSVWSRLPVPPQHVIPIMTALLVPARPRLPGLLVAPGRTMLAAGVVLNAWAVAVRRFEDLESPVALVTTGPYAVSRNPMYVGWSLIHLGVGLAARSPWVLLSWLYPFRLVHREVLEEERILSREFGDAFDEYAARVPRYVSAGRIVPVTSPRAMRPPS
jgi:protein-S-isoprenylcysteine O-methyltransferase Ste14